MGYNVHIIDTTTAETRTYRYDTGDWRTAETDDDMSPDEFMWGEGNYACDCNRSLFFRWAKDEEGHPSDDCGDTRYKVRITADDGTELYKDHDYPPNPPAGGE